MPRKRGKAMAEMKKSRAARKRKKTDPERFERRHERVAEAAYYKAERRGFAPGKAEEDWLEAELEVDAESDPA